MSEESEDEGDKVYEPTPRKIEKAREQGDIAQSKELHGLALYLGLLAASFFAGSWMINYIGARLVAFFGNVTLILAGDNTVSLAHALGELTLHSIIGMSPFIAGMLLFPLFSMVAQNSITFAPDKIMPNLSRISPIAGFKNKFGKEALVEFFKGCVKTACVGLGVWYIAMPMLETAPALIGKDSRQFGLLLGKVWIDILIAVTIIAAIIGVADFLWQKYSFMTRMMMSLKEMKDEMKDSEGDPHVKAKRKQMGRDIAMNQMIQEVPKADVVIVNPTHYAVALKWSKEKGTAPICIAKGIDEIALAIKEIAQKENIPVRSDPPLARTLHASVKIGEQILEEHYRAVAAAIRFADEQRRKQRNKAYT